jgi:hypothetical protein
MQGIGSSGLGYMICVIGFNSGEGGSGAHSLHDLGVRV